MKIGGHQTSFLVKYFKISQIPTRVFLLVKSKSLSSPEAVVSWSRGLLQIKPSGSGYENESKSHKNVGYSCVVLATADCCVYTRRHPLSLFTVIAEKKKITCVQFMHCYQVFPFSIKFSNIAFWSRFSTSSDKAKWQRKNCLQETVGKIDLRFSIFFV